MLNRRAFFGASAFLFGATEAAGAQQAATPQRFDLVLRSRVLIERASEEMWPAFLDMDVWMLDLRFRDLEGARGEEGQVRLVLPRETDTPFASYLVKTVRVTPYQQYVLKVTPERGDDYLGFADFSFTPDGISRTLITYDIYVELKIPAMSTEAFREFSNEQYARGRAGVEANNLALKALAEERR